MKRYNWFNWKADTIEVRECEAGDIQGGLWGIVIALTI